MAARVRGSLRALSRLSTGHQCGFSPSTAVHLRYASSGKSRGPFIQTRPSIDSTFDLDLEDAADEMNREMESVFGSPLTSDFASSPAASSNHDGRDRDAVVDGHSNEADMTDVSIDPMSAARASAAGRIQQLMGAQRPTTSKSNQRLTRGHASEEDELQAAAALAVAAAQMEGTVPGGGIYSSASSSSGSEVIGELLQQQLELQAQKGAEAQTMRGVDSASPIDPQYRSSNGTDSASYSTLPAPAAGAPFQPVIHIHHHYHNNQASGISHGNGSGQAHAHHHYHFYFHFVPPPTS